MATWLSFWNRDTRARNEPRLQDTVLSTIYVPYGKGHLARSDDIYCVGVESGCLHLITGIRAAELDDDPTNEESVLVRDSRYAQADFDRVVPGATVAAIRFLHANGSEHAIRVDAAGAVRGHTFQGRPSIRRLVGGAAELDTLL